MSLHKFAHRLNIEPHEIPRACAVALLHFLITCGSEIGRVGRDTYFLKMVGSDSIPYMYLFIALIMLLVSCSYGAIVARMRSHHLMATILIVGCALVVPTWAVLHFQEVHPNWLPYLIFCAADSFILFMLIHFWTLSNEVFDAWEGKRIFPVLGASGLFGIIVGGASTRFIADYLGTDALFSMWALFLVAAIPLTYYCGRWTAVRCVMNPAEEEAERLEHGLVGVGTIRRIWNQPLMRTLTYMSFPMWIIVYIVEFNYYASLNRVFLDESDLAGFLGTFVSLSSAMGLLIQCMFTPWLLRRFGVGATSLVYPFSLTLGSIALLIFSLFPASVGDGSLDLLGIVLLVTLARFCDVAIYFSVYDSALQLLYYATPDKLRGQARAFVGGMVFPLSIALAGGLLLWFRALSEPIYNVTFVAVSLAFLLVVLGLNITPDYLKALLANLDPTQVKRRNEVLRELGKLEASETRYVFLQSLSAKTVDEAIFAVNKLFENKDEELFEDLSEIVPNARPETLKFMLEQFSAEERLAHVELVKSIEKRLA